MHPIGSAFLLSALMVAACFRSSELTPPRTENPSLHLTSTENDDTDTDGIPDNLDFCPDDQETWNGSQDEDGCPDRAVDMITPEPSAVPYLEGLDPPFRYFVRFAPGASQIDASGQQQLDLVART